MSSKHDDWSHRIAAWSASGATPSAWCREHSVSLSSFTYWRGKLAASAAPAALPATLPLHIPPAVPTTSVEIRLAGGISLSVAAGDPGWLARLLRELGAC
ncbi:IS66 family insertion sequence element accessory protein TnpA [Xanthomonas cucurbitae]|uniref:IS66 family insertion sequence element accessory protein TnpA n=1 Tax=Xanthomonas cucurbitae TaxID=56453 RepID=UPI001331210A|nr:IS66 family insertion sequence element accessory protein TnpB [Xanthomonas cucurbitae]